MRSYRSLLRGQLTSLLACTFWLSSALAPLHANAVQQAGAQPLSTAQTAVDQTAKDRGPMSDPGGVLHEVSAESDGSVAVSGQSIAYHAVAGTLIIHPERSDENAPDAQGQRSNPDGTDRVLQPGERAAPEASVFYTAYFKRDAAAARRPITFLYNGGPGSSTIWLHMGAFGPRRVVLPGIAHAPGAPYTLANNAYSLLDASDLVFIDAPGTGFSRVEGTGAEKAFFGVDADAAAFSQFIVGFLSKYSRWNSPKYLFGESYGTTRNAVLVNNLETKANVDINGVIMLSQILNFDLSADEPELNPGTDEAYVVTLPTYAATARYHNVAPGSDTLLLDSFLREVETFAATDYVVALQAGDELPAPRRQAIAERLAHYTGLPLAYILRANLRIDAGEFEKNLEEQIGLTTGHLDARFTGPEMDPLSKKSEYDPQAAAISSAYVASFNTYVRQVLGFGHGLTYRPEVDMLKIWANDHQPPGETAVVASILNVMPDLAAAMKRNPGLKIMVNGGVYDLSTPFYAGWYEDHHLAIPPALQGNIEYHSYRSGHMVYVDEPSLKQLHDNVAAFIARTNNLH